MHLVRIALSKYASAVVLTCLCLCIFLFLTAFRPFVDTVAIHSLVEEKPFRLNMHRAIPSVTSDPIRFSIQSSHQTVRLNETIDLTITAELLTVSPNLLFFQPGYTAYTLKMILPSGFEQTGGDFADFVADELTYPARPLMVYHVRGHFRSVVYGTSFRLLRGRSQAGDRDLFVEKATVLIQPPLTKTAASQQREPATSGLTLYVSANNPDSPNTRLAANEYLGYLDNGDCNKVRGWIVSTNNLRQSQEVDILVNGIKVATILADLVRQDVANTLGVTGFNEYGYEWVVPDTYKNKVALTLSVRPAGTSMELAGSPKRTEICRRESIAALLPRAPVSVTATSTPAPAPSLPSFRRALVIGNSITSHPVSATIGWFLNNGMAASSLANDYVHKIETTLKDVNPAFEILALGAGSNLERIYNSSDADAVRQNIDNIRYDIAQRYGTEKVDLLLISISENVDNGTFNEIRFRSMLDQLMAGLADKLTPGATVVVRNGLWLDHEQADAVLKSYAQSKGYTFADMADIKETRVNGLMTWPYYAVNFSNASVRRHPNDAGHTAIANRFLNALKVSSPVSTTNPFTWQVPASQSSWDGVNASAIGIKRIVAGNYLAQENSQLRVEVRQGFGGSMQIYDKVTKQNLINFYDQGRGSGLSSYSYPLAFSNYATSKEGQAWWDIGYNSVPLGDEGGNPCPILFKGKIDGWLYTRAQSISWPHLNALTLKMTYEQWVKIDGNRVDVKVRIVHARTDKTQYEARSQEWPYVMVNGARQTRFYNGDKPFTFQQTVSTNGIERTTGPGSTTTHQGTPFYLTEPWMATEIGPGRLFGLVAPTMYKSNYNVAVPDLGDNYEGGNTMTYLCGQPFDHLDSDKITYLEYSYVVGTETDVRQAAYAIPRTSKPDFRFTKQNGRAGWYWFNGSRDQKEPFTDDNWKLTFVGKIDNGVALANITKIISPAGAWEATQSPVIYIRMKTNTSQRQMALGWATNQQAPEGAFDPKYPNQNQIRYPRGTINNITQRQVFAVNGNNQWNTYAIPVGTNSNWRGIIQQLELKHEGDVRVPANETFEIAYIGAVDPGN